LVCFVVQIIDQADIDYLELLARRTQVSTEMQLLQSMHMPILALPF